jgi:NTP pyrophosphatase (non-canonical NTP hydrolase)
MNMPTVAEQGLATRMKRALARVMEATTLAVAHEAAIAVVYDVDGEDCATMDGAADLRWEASALRGCLRALVEELAQARQAGQAAEEVAREARAQAAQLAEAAEECGDRVARLLQLARGLAQDARRP